MRNRIFPKNKYMYEIVCNLATFVSFNNSSQNPNSGFNTCFEKIVFSYY